MSEETSKANLETLLSDKDTAETVETMAKQGSQLAESTIVAYLKLQAKGAGLTIDDDVIERFAALSIAEESQSASR